MGLASAGGQRHGQAWPGVAVSAQRGGVDGADGVEAVGGGGSGGSGSGEWR